MRCNIGEMVIIDQHSLFGACKCFMGIPFVTKLFRRDRNGRTYWRLPTMLPACVHHRSDVGQKWIFEVNDALCRPIRPKPGPTLRRHNYWPYPPIPRLPPSSSMHQPPV